MKTMRERGERRRKSVSKIERWRSRVAERRGRHGNEAHREHKSVRGREREIEREE